MPSHVRSLGFSTLELVLTLAIFLMIMPATLVIAFGSGEAVRDSGSMNEALARAEKLLQNERALAQKDFQLVNSVSLSRDDYYQWKVDVAPAPDSLTKTITAHVSWFAKHGRTPTIELSTIVANYQNSLTATCDSVLSGNWASPTLINNQKNFAELVGDSTGVYPITDVATIHNDLLVTVNNASLNSKETFFVFDISNPTPTLLSKTDNAPTVSAGLNAITSDGHYAYVASAYNANFTTCSPGPNCAQLQIFDLNDVARIPPPINFKLPNVTGTSGVGTSIAYHDGYVYLGLASTGPGNGPEFHIIDVHNPVSPVEIGNFAVGHAVNAILIRDHFAYLAHPTNATDATPEQLTVLDISNPNAPVRVSGYHAADNQGNGKSLTAVGDQLFFGRTVTTTSNPELDILDISNPVGTLSSNMSAKISSSVDGLMVRDALLFVTTKSRLEIRSTSNPSSLAASLTWPASGGSTEPSLTCRGNTLYATSNDASNHGYLSVIGPG